MHIPTSMMDGAVCPVTTAVSAVGIVLATGLAWKSKNQPTPEKFAAVSACIFAGQMVNFPVQFGTSGHLLGGLLAAALLGAPFAVLSIALVVTLQCLVFADGGLSVLGANLLNMAILGAGVGGWIWHRLATRSLRFRPVTLALAAWFSVMLASFACSIELAVSGSISFSQVSSAMLGVHAFIGMGEALVTVAAISILTSKALQTSERRPVFLIGLSAFMIAMIVAPFACQWPDGLESVAQTLRFAHASSPTFVPPLAEYTVRAISTPWISTSLAGLLGVMLAFLAALGFAKIWHRGPAFK